MCGVVPDQSEERVVCGSRVYKSKRTPPGACGGSRERLGEARCVQIPQDIWDSIATPSALSAAYNVEVPRKVLRPKELAMIWALAHQSHPCVLHIGMRRFGRAPIAPIFIIPKSETKCSFIVNCTLGNRAHKGPMPPMALPNLHTLRQIFLTWAAMPRNRCPDRYMIKLDLTDCYFSLKLPQFAWGTFRVQGP